MKRLLIISILVLCHITAWSKSYRIEDIPNVQLENRYHFTSNPDGILSSDAVTHIDSVCYNLRNEGLVQIAVVAVEEIKGGDVFDFAYELFSMWGVGSKSDRGLGILLVEEEREIRFVTGYGIEGILPDAICKRIQTNYMLPYFRDGDYSGGMMAGISAVADVMRGGELAAEEEEEEDLTALFIFIGMFILLTTLLAYWVYVAAHKCPNCKKSTLQQQGSQLVSRKAGICTYEDTLTCSNCGTSIKRRRQTGDSSYTGRGGRGPFIGGGFGGRGGGSIGGGWGGGSFGGGGAGSRW